MRIAAFLAALFGALSAANAHAQSAVASQALPVSGNTPQVCSLGQGALRTGELVNFRGTDGDTLRVIQLIDPRTLATQSARATVSLGGVCNFPHRIRVESQDNGLWP